MEDVAKYLKALVYLQVQSHANGENDLKPEVLLARAGLDYGEIAELLNKNKAAVAKAVSRANNGK